MKFFFNNGAQAVAVVHRRPPAGLHRPACLVVVIITVAIGGDQTCRRWISASVYNNLTAASTNRFYKRLVVVIVVVVTAARYVDCCFPMINGRRKPSRTRAPAAVPYYSPSVSTYGFLARASPNLTFFPFQSPRRARNGGEEAVLSPASAYVIDFTSAR